MFFFSVTSPTPPSAPQTPCFYLILLPFFKIFHVVSRFPLLFMLYRGNLDCFSNRVSKIFIIYSKPKIELADPDGEWPLCWFVCWLGIPNHWSV